MIWNNRYNTKGRERLLFLTIILPLLMLLLIQSIHAAPLSSYLVSSFVSPDPSLPFNHITVNNDTGDIYIGAQESVFQLSTGLTLEQTVDVGPCPSSVENKNRLLVIAPSPVAKLITCGSCDGFCEITSLQNISADAQRFECDYNYVVSTADEPTVGIVTIGSDNTLYLFTGVSNGGHVHDMFISKRSLTDLRFRQRISSHHNHMLDQNFINVIVWKDYLYYFMNRMSTTYNNSVHVGRLCPKSVEHNLDSYTEIELICRSISESFTAIKAVHIASPGSLLAESMGMNATDDVLYAVFSGYESETPVQSALCMYKMSDVKDKLADAVLGCVTGDKTKGMPSDYLDGVCSYATVSDPSPFLCSSRSLYQYASGVVPLYAAAHALRTETHPTSLIVTSERGYTIALVGTKEGNILKIRVANNSSSRLYESVPVVSGSVLRDMFLEEDESELILATSSNKGSSVLRLMLWNCSQYQTCEECIGADGDNDGDPYCGWCTLEARCTRYDECPLWQESTHWLPCSAVECVAISDIYPSDRLPYYLAQYPIGITVEQLPDLKDGFQYECTFDSYETPSFTNGSTVSCVTPPANIIPVIPPESDHVTMVLSIKSTETDVHIVNRPFFFFDCSHVFSCSSCVTRPWPCVWCVYDNRCTCDGSRCPPDDAIIVNEQQNLDRTGKNGASFCPHLLSITSTSFFPVDVHITYTLIGENLPTDLQKVEYYECLMHVEGEEQRVRATSYNDSYITCGESSYTYEETILTTSVSVGARWNGQNNIDYLLENQVTLYKCSVNDESCSRCLSPEATPSSLQCGWCGNDCNVIQSDVCQNNNFLNQNQSQQCDPPQITSLFPISGPVDGNTRLDIRGTDIGVTFTAIKEVTVAGVGCHLNGLEDYYQPGRSVSCLTGVTSGQISGQIQVTIASGEEDRVATSGHVFMYRDPVISDFNPKEGAISGGTRLTIEGEFLNAGRDITARIGDYECRDLVSGEAVTYCTTTSVPEAGLSLILVMTFDGAERISPSRFTFRPNPLITAIDRTDTINSGGLMMTVTGERLDLVQEAKIIVISKTTGSKHSEICSLKEVAFICPTPPSPDLSSTVREKRNAYNDVTRANMAFSFDGYIVNSYTISYYPDPEYFAIDEPNHISFISENKLLKLKGSNLDLVSTKEDVQILVGQDGECDVLLLEVDRVVCTLPDKPLGPGDYKGSLGEGNTRDLPAIVIFHGNLEFRVGFVKFNTDQGSIHPAVIAVITVIAIFAVIVLVASLAWRFTHKRKIARAREELELVRRKVQARVNEVADTKLNLTEIHERVEKHGIPSRDLSHYVRLLLFDGLDIHPATSDPEYMDDFMEHSMIALCRQFKDKQFVLEYIKELELKNQGSQKTRKLIASFLAVMFMSEGKSIHFTEVVLESVRRRVTAESSTMLSRLFEKTDSIEEMLLANWMALFMYGYIQRHALHPMMMLYQAIKTQCEKGPVDAITGHAYYTLDGDRLLHQDVSFDEVTLFIVDEGNQVFMYVTVLDVDSVEQAKQKILDSFWKQGYCLLPREGNTLDLVWIQDFDKHTLLRNTDVNEDCPDSCKVNTMKSYGIHYGCHVFVTPKQASNAGSYQALDATTIAGGAYQSLSIVDEQPGGDTHLTMTHEHTYVVHLQENESETNQSTVSGYRRERRACLDKDLAVPHMLATKVSISPYLEKLFDVMFKSPALTPLPIKHLFDTLDDLAAQYGENMPHDLAEIWKRNCLAKFWETVLINLPSLFDMPRSPIADQCVDVLADVISHATRNVTPMQIHTAMHQPYLQDFPLQSRKIATYCQDLSRLPRVPQATLHRACGEISKEFKGHFSHQSTLLHLYTLTKVHIEDLD